MKLLNRAFRSLIVLAAAGSVAACGPAGLDGSSTCEDFMKASSQEQYEIVSTLATQYRKPDYTTPLGRPNIPYFCAQSPSLTLDRLFAKLS